jgi:hypothetical protein
VKQSHVLARAVAAKRVELPRANQAGLCPECVVAEVQQGGQQEAPVRVRLACAHDCRRAATATALLGRLTHRGDAECSAGPQQRAHVVRLADVVHYHIHVRRSRMVGA